MLQTTPSPIRTSYSRPFSRLLIFQKLDKQLLFNHEEPSERQAKHDYPQSKQQGSTGWKNRVRKVSQTAHALAVIGRCWGCGFK